MVFPTSLVVVGVVAGSQTRYSTALHGRAAQMQESQRFFGLLRVCPLVLSRLTFFLVLSRLTFLFVLSRLTFLVLSRLTFLFVLSRLPLSRLNFFDPIDGMHASPTSAVGLRPPFLPSLCSLERSHPEPRGATLPSTDVLSISRDTADRIRDQS